MGTRAGKGLSCIADIADFPFKSFAELKEALSSREFALGIDPLAAAEWSDRFNSTVRKGVVTLLSVLLIASAVSSIVAALLADNYWLFAGVPIIAVAFYCSHPGSPVQKWATVGGILSVVLLLNLILTGSHTAAALVAYAGLTFALVRAAGFINHSSFRKALLSDEAAFVAAYTSGACTLKDKKVGSGQ